MQDICSGFLSKLENTGGKVNISIALKPDFCFQLKVRFKTKVLLLG